MFTLELAMLRALDHQFVHWFYDRDSLASFKESKIDVDDDCTCI